MTGSNPNRIYCIEVYRGSMKYKYLQMMITSSAKDTYHGNDGLQSHPIAGSSLLHSELHISVHLDQGPAALHSHPYLCLAVPPHRHAAGVQVGRGRHLPPHCYGPMEMC